MIVIPFTVSEGYRATGQDYDKDARFVGVQQGVNLVAVASYKHGKLSGPILNEGIACKLFASCSRVMELINFVVLEKGAEPALMSGVRAAAKDMNADFIYTLLGDLQANDLTRSGAYFPYQGQPHISYGNQGERLMIAAVEEVHVNQFNHRLKPGYLNVDNRLPG